MNIGVGATVVARHVTTGVGVVTARQVPPFAKERFRPPHHRRRAGGAMDIAQNHIRHRPPSGDGARRHRMAIHQKTGTEARPRLFNHRQQRIMIGLPVAMHAALRLGEAQPDTVNGLAIGHHAGNGAEARADTRAGGVHPGWQRVLEHRGIQLPGLPVHVAESAREGGRDQGRAMGGGGTEDVVNIAVFAAAERFLVQPRGGDEFIVVATA